MKIYNGYKRLNDNYTLFTDAYEYNMGSAYLLAGKNNQEAVFDVFFRRIPNNGGYAIMAGVDKVIDYIQNLKFEERELNYFRNWGYPQEFIEYLKTFKFTGDIYAIPDGTPVFPNEPLLTVKAPLIEAQVIETAILALMNGAMEHATGARRIIEATPKGIPVMEFGSRRADGFDAGIDSAIYGIMAGCSGTSNIHAANMLNIKALGTMAHSFIESFDSELEAFMTWAKIYPDNCNLLVDTYDTLRSGIPNAIKVFKYMKEKGISTQNIGIRIDSGDLAYLSKQARIMMDQAGFPNAKICLSNGLDAETIESLVLQGAKFDSLGVGDNISKPSGRMGCVYKEVALNEDGLLVPKIKVSNDTIKTVNPGFKKLYRAYNKNGIAIADIMTERGEKIKRENLLIISPIDNMKNITINNFELRELQKTIFKNGELVYYDPEINEKKKYCESEMQTLYEEVKRCKNPHEYYVDGTENYINLKNNLIKETKEKVLRLER
ncbi:MAG: nicotinate phosphoribosyltransferase [Bacilli bacterium]|nr:nicotinate phosphoribosyltransferase [Bacilli bacterium]